VNRTTEKAQELAARLAAYFESERLEGPGDRLEVLPLGSPALAAECDHIDLIVNCTSVGLKRTDPSPLANACLRRHHLVYDTIYNPSRTRFLNEAQQNGARVANGLSLLLYQGVLAFELWVPGQRPLETMRRSLVDAARPGGPA
jgi:shikimate dehydrogenase